MIDQCDKGDGLLNPWLNQDIERLALTEREIDDLVAFLGRPQLDAMSAFGPKLPKPKPPHLSRSAAQDRA